MRRIPGSHAPNVRNRSSKHLSIFTGLRSIYRCLSNAALQEMLSDPKHKNWEAQKELNRRQKKRDKKKGLQA